MPRSFFVGRSFVAAAALVALTATAGAETLRWAAAGDSLTLDPHAQNEGPTHTLAHQMYEGLLQRDMSGQIIPALATSWEPLQGDEDGWRFTLRQGVTFHGGEEFNADDVVFSINRAKLSTSAMQELLNSVVEVRKVDDFTVDLITSGPNPILPSNLTNLFIMDEGWTTENGAEEPQDFAAGGDNFAVRNVNGTGAYMLESRAPGERTIMVANPDYWGVGEFPLEVTRIEFTPITNAATRLAALLSGEVDLILDVPVQDLERINETEGLKVIAAAQNRVIFFGMNLGADDIEADNVDGANPLADLRVRQAMLIAVNREAIQQVVMRGQSVPTGVIMPPFVNGWTEELDVYPSSDLDAARALMAEAGYGDGFSIRLDCPNDRYINDEAICTAVVGMLGRIGVDVTLNAQSKALHFPLIQNGETDFYMLGWGVPTFDSEYIFNFLVHSRQSNIGTWNGTGYANPELDAQIVSLASNVDIEARNAEIAAIWGVVQSEVLYIPVHNQILNWAMAENIEFPVQPENQPHFKFLEYSE